MIQELDSVILTVDLPEHGLKSGDLGTVVLTHHQRKGYEVEFATLDGETIAVTSVFASQVRPVGHHEIAHVRVLDVAVELSPAQLVSHLQESRPEYEERTK